MSSSSSSFYYHGRKRYNIPSDRTPSYDNPSDRTPSYRTPSYRTPSYRTPSYRTPSYTTSRMQQDQFQQAQAAQAQAEQAQQQNPNMQNQFMPGPGMQNPGMPNAGMQNPGMPNPYMQNPFQQNSGMPGPFPQNPGMPSTFPQAPSNATTDTEPPRDGDFFHAGEKYNIHDLHRIIDANPHMGGGNRRDHGPGAPPPVNRNANAFMVVNGIYGPHNAPPRVLGPNGRPMIHLGRGRGWIEAPDEEARRRERRQEDIMRMAESLAYIERSGHRIGPTYNPSWKR